MQIRVKPDKPPPGQHIQAGHFLGRNQRVTLRHQAAPRTQLDGGGMRRRPGQCQEGIQQVCITFLPYTRNLAIL
jgi:hypothetical protein